MGRQDGVVITIPPAGVGDVKTMGYVAIAATRERVQELRDAMDDFAPGNLPRSSEMAGKVVFRTLERSEWNNTDVETTKLNHIKVSSRSTR